MGQLQVVEQGYLAHAKFSSCSALPWEKYEILSEVELNFLGFQWKPIWRVVVIDLIYFGSKEAKNSEVLGNFL